MRSKNPTMHQHAGALAALALFLTLPVTLCLSACNTTEGAGEDIKALGEAIDEAAEDAKN